jgi:hypothetical protein
VNILSQVGYRLIGDIAGHKENELYKKTEKPEKAGKENNSILAEKYEKEVTMAGYHFGDEDYVILNGSIGIGLGLSGGLIMDRMDNIYFVRGGGIVNGLVGTIATEKLSVDTSEWGEDKFCEVISRGSFGFGMGLYGGLRFQ